MHKGGDWNEYNRKKGGLSGACINSPNFDIQKILMPSVILIDLLNSLMIPDAVVLSL